MSDTAFESMHARARRRWPSIVFPWESFARLCMREAPQYPDDLYVAGAAGYRIQAAWEAIEEKISPEVCRLLRRGPVADVDAEDLWSEARLKVMKDDDTQPALPDGRRLARIVRYRAKIQLVYYFLVIAKRIAISRDRSRRAGGAVHVEDVDVLSDAPTRVSTAPVLPSERQEMVSRVANAISAAYRTLTAEQRFLLAMVFGQGMSQREAGVMLGWSESKSSRTMKKIAATLNAAMADVAELAWASESREVWIEQWRKCWKEVAAQPVRMRAVDTGGFQ